MAGTSLFALIDDIASMLDSISTMTKVAAKKTAGVLGDDLALNAEQVSGVRTDRELRVVWAVAKGSVVNKVILLPIALVLSAFAPWAVLPLLMLGGGYLCFEGFEKVAHKLASVASPAARREAEKERAAIAAAVGDGATDLVALEAQKIKGAVRTDFVLSAEIIVIALGEMQSAPLSTRVGALVAVASIMTVGVYGLVAGIVKIDDAGLALARRGGALGGLGRLLVAGAPKLLVLLSVAGTAAMFLVGGSIVIHGVPPLHHHVEHMAAGAGTFGSFVTHLADGLIGVVTGGLLLVLATAGTRIKRLVLGAPA